MPVDLDGFVEIRKGEVELALLSMGNSAVHIDVERFWIDRDRAVEVDDGAIEVALVLVGLAAEPIGKGCIGAEGV